jgi:hypothetical protein
MPSEGRALKELRVTVGGSWFGLKLAQPPTPRLMIMSNKLNRVAAIICQGSLHIGHETHRSAYQFAKQMRVVAQDTLRYRFMFGLAENGMGRTQGEANRRVL